MDGILHFTRSINVVVNTIVGLAIASFLFYRFFVATGKVKLKRKAKPIDYSNVQKNNILDFIQFEEIKDDMIIENKGKKFSMVVQAFGSNYDLATANEKLAIEEGFVQTLNGMNFPFQIHVLSKKVDLQESIKLYDSNLNRLRGDYEKLQTTYQNLRKSPTTTIEMLKQIESKIIKKANQINYGMNTKQLIVAIRNSKEVLVRDYYIVISHYYSDNVFGMELSEAEIYERAYNDLYTKAQSIISGLSRSRVEATVLDNMALAELMYYEYNRDDAEVFTMKNAISSGFFRMYSTSKDVFFKKKDAIDEIIQQQMVEQDKASVVERLKTNAQISYEEVATQLEV